MLNLFYTVNPFYSRQVVAVNLACLALVWIVSETVNTDRRRLILLGIIIACGCVVSGEVLFQRFNGRGLLIPVPDPIGTIGNTNFVGAYLLFPIFALLALIRTPRLPRWAVVLSIFLLLLLTTALAIARARASWVACVVGMALWLYLSLARRSFVLVAGGCLLGCILAWSYVPAAWKNADTLGYRLKYWQGAVELWTDSPLLGIGFDGYRVQVYEAQAKINERNPGWFKGYVDPKPRRVHNDYLQALVDGGLLYFGTWIGFIVWVLVRSHKAARASPVARGIWCGQIAVMVCALFFFPFRLVDTVMLFHVQMGVLCASSSS